MIKKTFSGAIALSLLGLLVTPVAAARASELREVRMSASTADSASVELHLTRSAKHSLFTLENPHRVVVDFRDTRAAERLRIPQGSGLIRQIRTGQQPGGTLRVVVELKSAAASKGEWRADSRGGQRFVIALGQQKASPASVEELVPVRAAHAPTETDRDIVIAIDAGHGGPDPGAIGRGGTQEKTVVLAIARALANRINEEPGMRAVLTRDKDEFLKHRERMHRARLAKADLFVSIHADSIKDRSISGASVYVLSQGGATDEAARWLAERENAADLMGGIKLDDKDEMLASVLLDLSQSASLSASMTVAERVLKALDRYGEVRKPRVQQAPFLVLKSPDIPSILIETAYISNPADENRLKSSTHQRKLADAIFSGIRSYFETAPPPGTRFAKMLRGGLTEVAAASP